MARAQWLADRQADLLPIPYFHVVFTIPAPIAAIALQNKAVVYDILLKAAAETVRIIASYKDTGKVPNVVNLAKKTPATHMLVVRHRDCPGVLAHVFDRLRAGNINAQETENVIFEGAQAAVARINLDGAPPDALLKQIQDGSSDILDLHLVTI